MADYSAHPDRVERKWHPGKCSPRGGTCFVCEQRIRPGAAIFFSTSPSPQIVCASCRSRAPDFSDVGANSFRVGA